MIRWYLVSCSALACVVALIAACPTPKPKPLSIAGFRKDIVPRLAAVKTGCTPDTDDGICQNEAAKYACTLSDGCDSDGKCRFKRDTSASCECMEGELRWCPGLDGKQVQFCSKTPVGGAAWDRIAGKDACGPSRIACNTGNPTCGSGTQETAYTAKDNVFAWRTYGTCAAEPACPATGSTQGCSTGNQWCPNGLKTFDGTAWSGCKANPPEQSCACGGTRQCDGTCTKSIPTNYDQACGCGNAGRIGCDGQCSVPSATSRDVSDGVQLGDKLRSFTATSTECFNDSSGAVTFDVANTATSGELYCQFVFEYGGTKLWESPRYTPSTGGARTVDLSPWRGKTIHMALWTPGFLCAPGSGGGAANFRVPDRGSISVVARCEQGGKCL